MRTFELRVYDRGQLKFRREKILDPDQFFPLGGFPPVQSSVLDSAAPSLKRTPFAVALAWLLQRASNILLIPDKSSAEHLRENIEAASLVLSEDAIAELNDFGRTTN